MNRPFVSAALDAERSPVRKRAAKGILRKGSVSISQRGCPCYFNRGIRGTIAAIRDAKACNGEAFICDGSTGKAATRLWPRDPASYTKRACVTKPDSDIPIDCGADI